MSKEYSLKVLGMLIAAGFIGGAMSRAAMDLVPRASAQSEKADQVLQAGRFEVIDKQGRVRAALKFDNENKTTSLSFYNDRGVSVVNLDGLGDGGSIQLGKRPSLVFLTDKRLEVMNAGKVVWSAP